MPVSLERLIAEIEPNVITESLTRQCIQVGGTDAEAVEEKKATMPFREVECVAFSFKNLAKIDCLNGLVNLTKLQLDNNRIQRVENLESLVGLTWLDLSFNQITKIEGLDTLSKLVDLSLFNNNLKVIENLDPLVNLNVLSLGNNELSRLDNVLYLRRFRSLRLLNLTGNPLCKDHDYKSYVLSHVKDLTYLDYRRVQSTDVQAALEQHQDEMLELQEKEEQAALDEKVAADRKTHTALMRDAHLEGVESLLDDMVKEDPEWPRLIQVPNLLDGWNDVRDKFNLATEDFKGIIVEQHNIKKSEAAEYMAAVNRVLDEKDMQARTMMSEFEKMKKRTTLAVQDNPSDAEEQVLAPKVKLMALKDALLELEAESVEALDALATEFDRNYTELAENNKGLFNNYFAQVRDLANGFFSSLSSQVLVLLEKYGGDGGAIDALSEDARSLLQDKDTFMNALQASHDVHTSKIDGLEDALVSLELRAANDLSAANFLWARARNRDRITDIINYIQRNMADLDELVGEEEGGDM